MALSVASLGRTFLLRTNLLKLKKYLIVNKSIENLYSFSNYRCCSTSNKKPMVRPNTGDRRITHYFETNEQKNRDTFIESIRTYRAKEKYYRGHVEFILCALKLLEEYGLEKDLEIYKELMDVFPKEKMVVTNMFQATFSFYPKQQECACHILNKMESNGVIPDSSMQDIIMSTFGFQSNVMKKYGRMLYWMPKMRYISPWRLPDKLPNDALELAKMAVSRMASADPAYEISIFETKTLEEALDDTWIVSAQCPEQKELLKLHPVTESLKIEGPFKIYLQNERISYFILRAERLKVYEKPSRVIIDDISSIPLYTAEYADKLSIYKKPSVHEQEDGTIFALCATGTSSRNSVQSWIKFLEKSNPSLSDIPVLFTQFSPVGTVIPFEEKTSDSEKEA